MTAVLENAVFVRALDSCRHTTRSGEFSV